MEYAVPKSQWLKTIERICLLFVYVQPKPEWDSAPHGLSETLLDAATTTLNIVNCFDRGKKGSGVLLQLSNCFQPFSHSGEPERTILPCATKGRLLKVLVNSEGQTKLPVFFYVYINNKQKRCMPVANHGDPWQKPSQLCNYLPIKIFLK